MRKKWGGFINAQMERLLRTAQSEEKVYNS